MIERLPNDETPEERENHRILRDKYQKLKPGPDDVKHYKEEIGNTFTIEGYGKWPKGKE